MDYQTVMLNQRQIIGISCRTLDTDPDMQKKIGGLWQSFFADGYYEKVPDKADAFTVGLYSDYNQSLGYKVTVGCQVISADVPEGMDAVTIPAGKYAEFVVFGDVVNSVGKAWSDINDMSLQRTFTADFEEYRCKEASDESEIHIFVGLR